MQTATSPPSVHRNTQRCGRGREADSETGLQYNRARYYDPKVGRWLSQDPLGFAEVKRLLTMGRHPFRRYGASQLFQFVWHASDDHVE
jgi:RHS repeat-associated protein